MTRREAVAITRLWRGWVADRKTNNQAYREFVLDVIRAEPRLQHLSVFEILDAVINGEAWEEIGAEGRSDSRGLSARGPRTSDTAENRTRGQSGAARVVEVEEASDEFTRSKESGDR